MPRVMGSSDIMYLVYRCEFINNYFPQLMGMITNFVLGFFGQWICQHFILLDIQILVFNRGFIFYPTLVALATPHRAVLMH